MDVQTSHFRVGSTTKDPYVQAILTGYSENFNQIKDLHVDTFMVDKNSNLQRIWLCLKFLSQKPKKK